MGVMMVYEMKPAAKNAHSLGIISLSLLVWTIVTRSNIIPTPDDLVFLLPFSSIIESNTVGWYDRGAQTYIKGAIKGQLLQGREKININWRRHYIKEAQTYT